MQLTKFNTTNFDLITQLIFDDRIGIKELRIVKFLDIPVIDKSTGNRYKRTAFSCRGIAKIIGFSTGSVVSAIQNLKQLNIIDEKNGKYFLKSAEVLADKKMNEEPESDQDSDHSDQNSDQMRSGFRSLSDQDSDHNNNKEIIINNNTLIKEARKFCEIEKIHIADANKFMTNKELHDALPENIAKLICQKFDNNKELIRIAFRVLLCELQSERNLRGMTPEQCYRFLDKSWVRQEILKEFSAQKGAEVAQGKQNYYKTKKAIPSPENRTHGQAYKPFKAEALDLPKNPKVKELLHSILGKQ